MSNFDDKNIDLSRFAPIYNALVESGAITRHFVTETHSGTVVSALQARRGGVTGLDEKFYSATAESEPYFPFSHPNHAAAVINHIASFVYDPNADVKKRHGVFAEFSEYYAPVPEKCKAAMEKVESVIKRAGWNWETSGWRHNPDILGHWEHTEVSCPSITHQAFNVGVSSAGVVSIDGKPHYLGMVVSIDTPKLIKHVLEEKLEQMETKALANKVYGFMIEEDSPDYFDAAVINYYGSPHLLINSHDDYTNTLVANGALKDYKDVEGITKYLKDTGRIDADARIIPMDEFEVWRDKHRLDLQPKIQRMDTVYYMHNNERFSGVVGSIDKDANTFLSLTDGKNHSISSVSWIASSPELQRRVNSTTMDRTEHVMEMRSKATSGTDKETIFSYHDQDIREIAERTATGYGAEVISIDGVDYEEIKKQKHYLTIEIYHTETAAFADIGEMIEVKRILNHAANVIRSASALSEVDGIPLEDTNGNEVGKIAMTDASFDLEPGNIRIELAITGFNTPEKIAPFIDKAIDGIVEGKTEFQVHDGVEQYSGKDLITKNSTYRVAQVFVVPDPEKSLRQSLQHELLDDTELPGMWSKSDLIGGKSDMEPF